MALKKYKNLQAAKDSLKKPKSIFGKIVSSIGSSLKTAYNSVKSGFASVGGGGSASAIQSRSGGGISSDNSRAIPNLSGGFTYVSPNSPTAKLQDFFDKNIAPRTITSSGGMITSGPSGSRTITNSEFNIDPSITSESLGRVSSLSSLSGGSSGGSTNSVSMPGTPGYSDVAPNYSGIEGYSFDPSMGYVANPQEEAPQEEAQTQSLFEKSKSFLEKNGLLPVEKESVYDDRDVRRARREVEAQKQIVADYTSQLNSVIAKQQADLLRVRETGSQEGVTETVYGGQELTINREAAIKALPIQAALASAQGNLQLTQDYLNDLIKIRSEEIDNEYNYKKELRNYAMDKVSEADKRKLQQIDKAEERAYQEKQDNKQVWLSMLEDAKGNPALLKEIGDMNYGSPSFEQDVERVMGKMTGGGGDSNKVLSILDVARYEEIYPDAGVEAGDTEAEANAKVRASNSPEAQLNLQITGFKDNGVSYQQVVKDIKASKTIADKETALAVAAQVYEQGSGAPTSLAEARAQEIERIIAQQSSSGILKSGDIRANLRSRGYSNDEINASSVGGFMDKLSSFLFAE